MEEHVYQQLYDLEDGHWWFRGRRAVLWAMLSRAGLPERPQGARRRLRDGAQPGRVRPARAPPAASTRRSQAIEFCRRRGLGEVEAAGIESLPFADGTFDLILATDVLEHVERDDVAATELRRVAAPGALLLVTVPAYGWLWSQHDDSHHHLRRYTARQPARPPGGGGLAARAAHLLQLAAAAADRAGADCSRGAARRGTGAPTTSSPAGLLNRALELPMRAEAALIARGARFPAGVSIGMVCRPA